jgi:nicotinamidase-related amidase
MPNPTRRLILQAGLAGVGLVAGHVQATAKERATTLLGMAKVESVPAKLSESVLVLIDAQNEYRGGPLTLDRMESAIAHLASLLQRARASGIPIIHVAQIGDPGDMFDRTGERGQFISEVAPLEGEFVIEKPLPNSFARTGLQEHLSGVGRKNLIIAGFMTHMCVSSTVRAGFDLDYRITVASDATATRALPAAGGGRDLTASQVQAAALAAMADYFATIVPSAKIPA